MSLLFTNSIFFVFFSLNRECSSETANALERILGIWKERDVYDQIFLDRLRKGMGMTKLAL